MLCHAVNVCHAFPSLLAQHAEHPAIPCMPHMHGMQAPSLLTIPCCVQQSLLTRHHALCGVQVLGAAIVASAGLYWLNRRMYHSTPESMTPAFQVRARPSAVTGLHVVTGVRLQGQGSICTQYWGDSPVAGCSLETSSTACCVHIWQFSTAPKC
jgi:hypothetical protein